MPPNIWLNSMTRTGRLITIHHDSAGLLLSTTHHLNTEPPNDDHTGVPEPPDRVHIQTRTLRPREYFYPTQFTRPNETTNLRLKSFVSKTVSEDPQYLHNKWLRIHHAIWWNKAPTYDTHHSEYVLIQIVHNLEEDCTKIHVLKKVPITQFHVTDQNLVYGQVFAEDDFPRRTNHLENYNTHIYIAY
ncbi:hypothetical protein PQX77_022078 [Marasmius sp. AFHP31]|nr:hypothetical protein PQX77_022078 [Marasmius sp. AFHP31]